MTALMFDNPVFPEVEETFVTVRRGVKWATLVLQEMGPSDLGPEVNLTDTEEQVGHGKGRILGFYCGALEGVPEEFLEIEHDPDCHTRDGLEEELRRVYSDAAIDRRTLVTALLVQRTA